ncbi:MAG: 30S ribosomal protein S16 [bacterium]|nr:30S ribosomal protein S16 [bacterium]
MTVKIRLSKIGRKGKAIYKLVVSPERSKQKGQAVEEIGYFDKSSKTPVFKYDKAKFEQWLKNGAQLSDGARKLLKQMGEIK